MSTDSIARGLAASAGTNASTALIVGGSRRLPTGEWGIGGDSRSLAWNNGSRDSRYLHPWLEAMLGGALHFSKANVSALGGITSTTFVSTYLGPLIAFATVGSVVLIGANDVLGSVTEADTKTNLTTVVTAHKMAGKALILLNEYPFQTGWSADDYARHLRVRDHIDSLHDPANGIWVANIWDAMTDSPRGFTVPATYLKSDQVHPTPRGSAKMALAIKERVEGAFGGFTPLNGRPSPLYNPNSFSGYSTPSLTGLTVTDTTIGGIAVRKLILNNVAGSTGALFTMDSPGSVHSGFTDTSKVDTTLNFKVVAGQVGLAAVYLSTLISGGTAATSIETGSAIDLSDGGSANREYYPDFEVSGVLHPALVQLANGTYTKTSHRLAVAGRSASENITAEIWVWLGQFRAF